MKYIAQSIEILNKYLSEEISKDELIDLYNDDYIDTAIMEGFAIVAEDLENGTLSPLSQALLYEGAALGLTDDVSPEALVESGLVDLETVGLLSEDESAFLSEGLGKKIGATILGAGLLASGAANVAQHKQNTNLKQTNAAQHQQIQSQNKTIQGQHTTINGLKAQLKQSNDAHAKTQASLEKAQADAKAGSGWLGKKSTDTIKSAEKSFDKNVAQPAKSGWGWVKNKVGLK